MHIGGGFCFNNCPWVATVRPIGILVSTGSIRRFACTEMRQFSKMDLISRSLLFVSKVYEFWSVASMQDWIRWFRATGGTGSLAFGISMSYFRSIRAGCTINVHFVE